MGKRLIGSVGLKPGTDTGFDLDQKGQIHGYSDQQFALPVGDDDQVLTADSGEASGLKWASAGGVTLTSQTFNQTEAETTTSTSYVATNFTLTLPTRSGGYAIITTNYTHKNSGTSNANYFTIYDDASSVDVYTASVLGNDTAGFSNHIFSLDGSVIKLYMKTTAGTCTLIFSSDAVEGNMQSLEIS